MSALALAGAALLITLGLVFIGLHVWVLAQAVRGVAAELQNLANTYSTTAAADRVARAPVVPLSRR